MSTRSSISESEGRDWIATLRDRWRLQVLARRVKRGPDGTLKEVPSRVRRFVEGIPWAHVKPAIDALLASAPYRGTIANGVDFGVAYRPTLTVWQRDAQSAAVGAVRPDATYTLVQDLVEDTARDAYAVGSSSSCSEEAVTDYVWDAPGVEDLPEGGQGVTYAIAAVHRNDDGTFDYQVVKRVAKTQHVEPIVVRDDATSRVTQELWDNVYTGADGGYADETGARIAVPAAGARDGVLTRIEGLSENPDCTLKFQVVRETAKSVDARETCKKTMFEHEHGTVSSGESAAPGHVPSAGGGHYEEVDSQLQPDGTFTVTSKATDEQRQASGAEFRRTPRAMVTTTTVRNTTDTASMPSSPGRESHEMTPGGLYNLTVTTATPGRDPDSARCAVTVFEHVHDQVTMSAALDPDANASAGGGSHSEVVQDMDEYGIVKKVVRTTTETRQVSGKDYRRTARGLVVTTVTRNTPETAGEPAVPGRESHEMTPGGLYNLTVTTATPGGTPDSARCAATVFEETDDLVTMSGALAVAHFRAGNGSHGEVVQDMDEYGIVKKVVRTTTEIERQSAVTERAKHLEGVVDTTVNRNMPSPASSASVGIGGSVRNELTPGGRYNQTIVSASPEPVGEIARFCEQNHAVHTHSVTSGVGTVPGSADAASVDQEDGLIHSVKLEQTQLGAWRRTDETREASPLLGTTTWTDKVISTSRIQTYSNVFKCFRNYTEAEVQRLVDSLDVDEKTVHHSRNDYGLLDGSVHGKKLVSDEPNLTSGSGHGPGEQGDKHSTVETYLRRKNGRYVERLKFTAHRRILWSTPVNMLAEVIEGQSRPDLGWVSAIHGWYADIYTDIRQSEKGWEIEG